MTMKCKICSASNKLDIDREIINSGNLSLIAKKFRVPYSSLYNHAQNHVTRQLATAMEKKQTAESFDLLARVDQIIGRAEDIFKRNYDKGADVTALKALDSQRNTIELLAKISYSLHQAKQAELDLARELSGENNTELNEEYSEMLQILTTPELEMLSRLQMKVQEQTHNIIIPEEKDMFANIKYNVNRNENNAPDEEEDESDLSLQTLKRTKSNKMSIKNVEPVQIPFTKKRVYY